MLNRFCAFWVSTLWMTLGSTVRTKPSALQGILATGARIADVVWEGASEFAYGLVLVLRRLQVPRGVVLISMIGTDRVEVESQ